MIRAQCLWWSLVNFTVSFFSIIRLPSSSPRHSDHTVTVCFCQGGSLKVTAFTLCYLPCPGLPPSLRLSSCNTDSLSFCLSSSAPLLTFLSTRLALRRPFSDLLASL